MRIPEFGVDQAPAEVWIKGIRVDGHRKSQNHDVVESRQAQSIAELGGREAEHLRHVSLELDGAVGQHALDLFAVLRSQVETAGVSFVGRHDHCEPSWLEMTCQILQDGIAVPPHPDDVVQAEDQVAPGPREAVGDLEVPFDDPDPALVARRAHLAVSDPQHARVHVEKNAIDSFTQVEEETGPRPGPCACVEKVDP